MAFIDASVVNAKMVIKGVSSVASAQNILPTVVSTPSANTSKSVFSTVTGGLNGVSTGVGSLDSAAMAVGQTTNTIARTVDTVNKTARFISSALKSISSTFSSSPTALASGISDRFTKVFNNTNIVDASTSTRKISDPITSFLASKTPGSSAYRISSLQNGSQAVGLTGGSSIAGSGADLMIGTQMSTLIKRYNLDSSSRALNASSNSLGASKLNGLFSTLNRAAVTVRAVTNTVQSEVRAINNVVVSAKREYDAITGVVNSAKDSFNALTSISSINDFTQFVSSVDSLAVGVQEASVGAYYLTNATGSLIDQTGAIIDTYGSGVDAVTANALLQAMSRGGCNTTTKEYLSANNQGSLFNLSIGLASKYGMGREVNDLLGCSFASSPLGQRSITNAFTTIAGSNVDLSTRLLKSVVSSSSIFTNTLGKQIVTNPKLTAVDATKVSDLFSLLGSSPTEAFTLPGTAGDKYPIFDASTLISTQPSFLSAMLGDATIVDYFNSQELKPSLEGLLKFA
jgi:hypothetical protein